MKFNLISESFEFEIDDYSECMIRQFNLDIPRPLIVKENTAHGFTTTIKLPKSGIYLIYKFQQLIYVGYTETSIRNRLGRFVAGVRGTEHEDEQHIAAYKYREVFGTDLSNVYIKAFGLDNKKLNCGITTKDIEFDLIDKLQPLLNNENYHNYDFRKVVLISPRNSL